MPYVWMLCVISSLKKCLLLFFLSHPICENLCSEMLLYQAPAAVVVLDSAGSRDRKRHSTHGSQRNLEIPLIYSRFWLQSKPVTRFFKKHSVRQLCLGCKCQNWRFFSHHLHAGYSRDIWYGCVNHEVLGSEEKVPLQLTLQKWDWHVCSQHKQRPSACRVFSQLRKKPLLKFPGQKRLYKAPPFYVIAVLCPAQT